MQSMRITENCVDSDGGTISKENNSDNNIMLELSILKWSEKNTKRETERCLATEGKFICAMEKHNP